MAPSVAAMGAALLTTQTAVAQSAIDALTSDTIVVTATKKSGGENVQDTSISMSAFGEEQLDAFQVRDITGLSFKTPNVALDDIGTAKGTANFTIRGLGVNSSIPSIDPTVGVFVDGVYYGVNAGVILDTFDLSSVETLRGPQGVLFGRNVTGGAVLINTGDPTDEFRFKAKAAAESGLRSTGENYYIQGVVSGPLVEDLLTAKLGVYYNDDGGWFTNGATGEDFGESETFVIRGALRFTPTDSFQITAKYEHGDSEGDGPAAQTHRNQVFEEDADGNLTGEIIPGTIAFGNPALDFDRNTHDFSINEPGFNESTWNQASVRMDIDVPFGDGTITNIFGYREYEQLGRTDVDATPVTVFHVNFNTLQDQISNELRYNGRFFDGRLDFTTGIFYFNQTIRYGEQRDVQGVFMFDGGGVQDHDTFGIFAQGEYLITDRLSFNAGLRYNEETKEVELAQLASEAAPCITFSGDPRSDTFCPIDLADTFESTNWSPKVGFGYEVADNLRVYGHWARAFRAGGYNFRNTSDEPGEGPGPFQDERVDSFEIGLKSEPVAGARLNGAIFFNRIVDMQREINEAGGTAIVKQFITNSADANIYGIEVDATYPLTDNFVLTGSIGYVKGEYTDVTLDLNRDGVIDGLDEDLDIPRLAPLTANAGFTYLQEIPGVGDATLNFNYAHRDQAAYTDNNLGFINEQNRFDASARVDFGDSGASLTLYGKNLTNEVLHGNDTQLGFGGTFAPLSKGRQVGIELQLDV